ncbi:sufE-like protein 1, chloroplastic/mitochondrial [Diospyros lotus]|uniref:sufE-like protein 1, chloroplastic/mitochondrial n=1 Tax=Diospyros lotus TaxID=55363 RepID=UPI00224F0769|nr:sufE-like protein 1, chloroplastic/mitochondrial [Diospyros lotus]
MEAMPISTSFRRLCTKFPPFLLFPNPRISKTPQSLSYYWNSKSISIQKLPTKLLVSSSSSPSVSLQPIEELPPKLQEIVKLFQAVSEPKAKYEQLLFYGKNLNPLDARFKTSENKVQGCVSQVWVRAYFDDEKNVVFEADSDSVLTKGLAALLVQGLSGRPVQEILRVSPDFAMLLGLQQSLTPSRNNGFLNMLKLMQKKALQLYAEAENNDRDFGGEVSKNPDEDSNSGSEIATLEVSESASGSSGSNSGPSTLLGSRGKRIEEKLERELKPTDLQIEDISYQHAGHAGARGSNGETHFNIKLVSKEFEGKSLVKRHRLIYDLLQDELQSGLHALSIVAKTPSEVDTS